MSTELATTTAAEVVDRSTGEVVSVQDATTTDLAEMRANNGRLLGQIGGDNRVIDQELAARLDHEATRSATVGDYKLTVTAPTVREVDAVGLRAALLKLVEEGVLSQSAVDKAVEIVEDIKPRRVALNALHKHVSERVRAVVADYDREVENPTRRVSVKEAIQ